jgi:hypothetical protein
MDYKEKARIQLETLYSLWNKFQNHEILDKAFNSEIKLIKKAYRLSKEEQCNLLTDAFIISYQHSTYSVKAVSLKQAYYLVQHHIFSKNGGNGIIKQIGENK